MAPGILGAIVLLAGIALIDGDAFIIIRYAIAILAAIIAVILGQGKAYAWIAPFAAVVVVWNPIFPFDFSGDIWLGAQYVAALVFIAAAVWAKVPIDDEPARTRGQGRA